MLDTLVDTVVGSGDAAMNEMSPRPLGAGLRWGRGIVHKSASQRKIYSRGLGVWPVLSLLTSTQAGTCTLLAFPSLP